MLWRVEAEASRAVLIDDAVPAAAAALPLTRLSSAEPFIDTPLPGAGSSVRLAQTADPAWRATLDGTALVPAAAAANGQAPGLQEFALPAGAQGQLVVVVDDGPRTRWLWAQAIAWVVVAILALPARRSAGDDDADDDIDPDADAADAIESDAIESAQRKEVEA